MNDASNPNAAAGIAAIKDQEVRLRDRSNGFRRLVSHITQQHAVAEAKRVFELLKSATEKQTIEKGVPVS